MLWVGLLEEIRPEQPTQCPSRLTGLHQRVKGQEPVKKADRKVRPPGDVLLVTITMR